MRVSPAALVNRCGGVDEALRAADRQTAITHNRPEGMKGGRATTHAIWLAFQVAVAANVRRAVEHAYGYDLARS